MELLSLICPNSTVWKGYPFSECFDDLVLGFGGNVISLILLAMTGILWRDGPRRPKMRFPERFLVLVPALGACVSLIDVGLISWELHNERRLGYHDLIYRCSQLSVWTTILLLYSCSCWHSSCCSRVLCFWWILKPLLLVPHLQIILASHEALWIVKECSVFLLDVTFGITINILRVRRTPSNSGIGNQMEDPLLVHDLEEDDLGNSETVQSIWALVTFNRIKSVMDKGVTKQLDFEDLLSLPFDMDPSRCHNALLTSWQAQQRYNTSNPSFFKAICSAYGRPYVRLGLLKVLFLIATAKEHIKRSFFCVTWMQSR